MTRIRCRIATEGDIAFIDEVYRQNMAALHGVPRSEETWKQLLSDQHSVYYIVYTSIAAAWFRLDEEDGGLWLGMLQVKPACRRQGVGRAILAAAEALAKEKGYSCLGIHTTRDNAAARGLYTACGYVLTETGPCTTADGVERVGCTYRKDL